MKHGILQLCVGTFIILCLGWGKGTFGAYVEGIDTTDVNGYGLDSAFVVTPSGQVSAATRLLLGYGLTHTGNGYFNYSFEDINMTPEAMSLSPASIFENFAIKKNDSTISKIQLLQKFPDNRWVFRYGTNSTPNDTLLINQSYDQSIRYKPANVHISTTDAWSLTLDRIYWSSPLPNNNHLIGYILYQSKGNAVIDTTKAPDPNQWDSLAFTDSLSLPTVSVATYASILTPHRYLNLVAVYTEGKSDFLSGWTYFAPDIVGTKPILGAQGNSINRIKIKKMPSGYVISYQQAAGNMANFTVSLLSLSGREVARVPLDGNKSAFLSSASCNVAEGLYVLHAEMPDRTVPNQPFLFAR